MKRLLLIPGVIALLVLLPAQMTVQPALNCTGTDAAVELNGIVKASETNGQIRQVFLPVNITCYFKTRPNPITTSLTLVGLGGSLAHSTIERAYAPLSTTEQFLHYNGGVKGQRGGGIRHIEIVAGNVFETTTPTVGGRAIFLSAIDSDFRPGYMLFDDIYITARENGNWWRNIDVDGVNASEQGKQGVRNVTIRDSFLFCASDANIYARNAVHFFVRGGASVVGTGTCQGSGKIRITGNNTATTNTTDFALDTTVYGDIILERCHIGYVAGIVTVNVQISSSCTSNGTIVSQINGKLTNNAGWRTIGQP